MLLLESNSYACHSHMLITCVRRLLVFYRSCGSPFGWQKCDRVGPRAGVTTLCKEKVYSHVLAGAKSTGCRERLQHFRMPLMFLNAAPRAPNAVSRYSSAYTSMLCGLILPVEAALLESTEPRLQRPGGAAPAACYLFRVSCWNRQVLECMRSAVGFAVQLVVMSAAFKRQQQCWAAAASCCPFMAMLEAAGLAA
jgi:hypothetical protein